MDQKKIDELASIFAKEMKTEKDLNDLSKMLMKATIEKVLGVELDEHLGYSKNSPEGHNTGNNRNGYSQKTVKTDTGDLCLETPRDRNGTFEPEFVKKHQTRLTNFDDKILSLYARGMTTRDIVDTFKEMYDADVSPTLISKVTDAVIEEVIEWQNT